LIGDEGDVVERLAAPPDAEGLRQLVEPVGPQGRVRVVCPEHTCVSKLAGDPAVFAEPDVLDPISLRGLPELWVYPGM
jgi:hypothetical protein